MGLSLSDYNLISVFGLPFHQMVPVQHLIACSNTGFFGGSLCTDLGYIDESFDFVIQRCTFLFLLSTVEHQGAKQLPFGAVLAHSCFFRPCTSFGLSMHDSC